MSCGGIVVEPFRPDTHSELKPHLPDSMCQCQKTLRPTFPPNSSGLAALSSQAQAQSNKTKNKEQKANENQLAAVEPLNQQRTTSTIVNGRKEATNDQGSTNGRERRWQQYDQFRLVHQVSKLFHFRHSTKHNKKINRRHNNNTKHTNNKSQ